MTMKDTMVIQGRSITLDDMCLIRRLIDENPSWHRTRLSKELCQMWNWRAANGRLKDMACRTFLLKLDKSGHITLPAPIKSANNSLRHQSFQPVLHSQTPIEGKLRVFAPIRIMPVEETEQITLFKTFLKLYHYLGYSGPVGENMKYMAFDHQANPLACLLFGSAAWKVAPRDTFIGWDAKTRQHNLHFITNNMRFLILPWVRIPYLASHILGQVARRLSDDWQSKYGHAIYLLETFVECGRFRGICYQAANWSRRCGIGQTKGRSRNDRYNSIQVPVKDVYLYPLAKDFQRRLRHDPEDSGLSTKLHRGSFCLNQ
jgi:hypothetical protein